MPIGPDGWKAHLRELGVARKRRSRTAAGEVAPRTTAPHIATGQAGEERAAALLTERGLSILARNVRYDDGELDLVADDGGVLVFVEVKRRRNASRGTAAEAVTSLKRARVVRAARRWLASNGARREREVRFDVIAIQDESHQIEWIRGAFDAS